MKRGSRVGLAPISESVASTTQESLSKRRIFPSGDSVSSSSTEGPRRRRRIGGPGTILPFWIESLASWIFAIFCLGVALYYWAKQWIQVYFRKALPKPSQEGACVPLVTHSRYELTNFSGLERHQQLMQYLERRQQNSATATKVDYSEWNDEDWIHQIRTDLTLRRLVSLVRLLSKDIPLALQKESPLIHRLGRIWLRLLALPDLPPPSDFSNPVSAIIAAYKEDGMKMLVKIQHAMNSAICKSDIEWILVDAGQCSRLEVVTSQFPSIKLIQGSGGGRGPSLNQGAAVAQGRILVFLHADTRLISGWDIALRKVFEEPNNKSTVDTTIRSTAAAFSFAIDTTPKGLQGGPFPPGIKAIEATANWRTHLFSLPYGDQCLSVPKTYLDYLGGFPHQCLMEDYELVSLLRHRRLACQERLSILSLPAYCGPRRWQALGVLYVTYTNSKCVRMYASGQLTPDQLYEVYYGSTASGVTQLSPWEAELQEDLARDTIAVQ